MTAFVLPAAAAIYDLSLASSGKDAFISAKPVSFKFVTNSLPGVVMANPSQIKWTVPTQHTDGTPLSAGEITSYNVGVRLASGTAGTYAYTATASASATSELISQLSPTPPTGVPIVAGVQAVAAQGNSAYAESSPVTLLALPNPPTAVTFA